MAEAGALRLFMVAIGMDLLAKSPTPKEKIRTKQEREPVNYERAKSDFQIIIILFFFLLLN